MPDSHPLCPPTQQPHSTVLQGQIAVDRQAVHACSCAAYLMVCNACMHHAYYQQMDFAHALLYAFLLALHNRVQLPSCVNFCKNSTIYSVGLRVVCAKQSRGTSKPLCMLKTCSPRFPFESPCQHTPCHRYPQQLQQTCCDFLAASPSLLSYTNLQASFIHHSIICIPPLQPPLLLSPNHFTAECPCRARGCGMLPAAAPPALYGSCAFNDAAGMAATVTRLEAELALAKAALADSHASQEGLHRQKRALEADVARLHAEVPFCHLGTAVSMVTHPILHSIIDSFIHKWLQAFTCHMLRTSCMIGCGTRATIPASCVIMNQKKNSAKKSDIKSPPVFKSSLCIFSKPFLFQTFLLTLNQMHVVVFSESPFHVENLL